MLPPEAITEYKEIYFKIYKIKLSDKEATRRANKLVQLYSIVLGDQLKNTNKTT